MTEAPRGIRNLNPGNLRPLSRGTFIGQSGVDTDEPDPPYIIFADMAHGIRAIVRELLAYQNLDGCRTMRQIFTRWAPGADNNDPNSYAGLVAAQCSLGLDQPFTWSRPILIAAVTAIVREENGTNSGEPWIDAITIAAGVDLGLGNVATS